jgi:hypothetical protein
MATILDLLTTKLQPPFDPKLYSPHVSFRGETIIFVIIRDGVDGIVNVS